LHTKFELYSLYSDLNSFDTNLSGFSLTTYYNLKEESSRQKSIKALIANMFDKDILARVHANNNREPDDEDVSSSPPGVKYLPS